MLLPCLLDYFLDVPQEGFLRVPHRYQIPRVHRTCAHPPVCIQILSRALIIPYAMSVLMYCIADGGQERGLHMFCTDGSHCSPKSTACPCLRLEAEGAAQPELELGAGCLLLLPGSVWGGGSVWENGRFSFQNFLELLVS